MNLEVIRQRVERSSACCKCRSGTLFERLWLVSQSVGSFQSLVIEESTPSNVMGVQDRATDRGER